MDGIIREKTIGDIRLILGCSQKIMPALDGFDIVTDPPYGIGESGGSFRDRKGGGARVLKRKYHDKKRPCNEHLRMLCSPAVNSIVWGGNYFADIFPPSKAWLYWDKLMGGNFADGELAWTNLNVVLRKFTMCNKMPGKQHPTQKPDELMKWCIGLLPFSNLLILDPFMGSGTTMIACAQLGRAGVGIELDPDYFDIACQRVAAAYEQKDMFIDPPKLAVDYGLCKQGDLL